MVIFLEAFFSQGEGCGLKTMLWLRKIQCLMTSTYEPLDEID